MTIAISPVTNKTPNSIFSLLSTRPSPSVFGDGNNKLALTKYERRKVVAYKKTAGIAAGGQVFFLPRKTHKTL